MYEKAVSDLALYRIEKAKSDLADAVKTLELDMLDTAANRSYYAIFHAARAVLALDKLDFKRHSGVISNFQKLYIKTGIFDRKMSVIIKSAFDMRSDSDCEDFYIVSRDEVKRQVEEAGFFVSEVEKYILKAID